MNVNFSDDDSDADEITDYLNTNTSSENNKNEATLSSLLSSSSSTILQQPIYSHSTLSTERDLNNSSSSYSSSSTNSTHHNNHVGLKKTYAGLNSATKMVSTHQTQINSIQPRPLPPPSSTSFIPFHSIHIDNSSFLAFQLFWHQIQFCHIKCVCLSFFFFTFFSFRIHKYIRRHRLNRLVFLLFICL